MLLRAFWYNTVDIKCSGFNFH